MKITKRRLKRIIKEEKLRLNEQWDSGIETGSDLLGFAKAYASLGTAVQEQLDALVAVYFSGGGPDSQAFEDAVWNQNPNAIEMAREKLAPSGRMLGGEAEDILNALDVATEIYNAQGK